MQESARDKINFKKRKNMIFIPGNITSSKNSKRIIRSKKSGLLLIIDSKATAAYKRHSVEAWKAYREDFLRMCKGKPKPLHILFSFVRQDKRKFDFVNMLQLPLDCMVQYGWIEDDDYLNIVPVINPEVKFDKQHPGLWISNYKL